MRRGLSAAALAAFFSLALLSAEASWAALAAAHAEEALALHRAGRDDLALSELEAALSWNPASSDALYLAALLDERGRPEELPPRGPLALKAERLAAALAADSFHLIERDEGLLLLAESLCGLARWEECARVLAKLGPERSPEAWLLGMKAAWYGGRMDEYHKQLNSALDLWPTDPRFLRFWAGNAAGSARTKADEAVLARVGGVLEALYAADPELLVLMAPLTADQRRREANLRRYRTEGGGSRAGLTECLRYGLEEEGLLVQGFMDSAEALYVADIDALFGLLSGGPRATFLSWLSSADLEISGDANGDSLPDSRALYRGGTLISYQRDADQDGYDEMVIDFSDGAPTAARLGGGIDGKLSMLWRSYPEIESLSYAKNGLSTRLSYGAGNLRLQPLSFSAPWTAQGSPLRLAHPSSLFAPPALQAAILTADRMSLEEVDSTGRLLFRHVILRQGLALMEELIAGKVVIERRDFERGIPRISRMDLDEDGRFDALRSYGPTGDPLSLEVDADGDGKTEYRESYGKNPLKEWDFTADGLMDASEELSPDGMLLRRFSSALDGKYDVVMSLKGAELVSVSRDGRPLSLRKESSGRVTWLGEQPFSLGPDIPAANGVYKRSGRLVHVYHALGMVYAELVR